MECVCFGADNHRKTCPQFFLLRCPDYVIDAFFVSTPAISEEKNTHKVMLMSIKYPFLFSLHFSTVILIFSDHVIVLQLLFSLLEIPL